MAMASQEAEGPDRRAEPELRELVEHYANQEVSYFRVVRYRQPDKSYGKTVSSWLDLWRVGESYRLHWNSWLGNAALMVLHENTYVEDRLSGGSPAVFKDRKADLEDTDSSLRWRSSGTPLLSLLMGEAALDQWLDEDSEVTFSRRPGVDRTLVVEAGPNEKLFIELNTSGPEARIVAMELSRENERGPVAIQRDEIIEYRSEVTEDPEALFSLSQWSDYPVDDRREDDEGDQTLAASLEHRDRTN